MPRTRVAQDTVSFPIRLSRALWKEIQREAAARRISGAEVIRALISTALRERRDGEAWRRALESHDAPTTK